MKNHQGFEYNYESLKIDPELKYSDNISTYRSRINLDDLATANDLFKLAVCIGFYIDNLWYRANIKTQPLNNIIKVEFVNYDNAHDSIIKDLVYLTSLFAKFASKTLEIDSIADIDEIKVANDTLLQKTFICDGCEDKEYKNNWHYALSTLNSVNGNDKVIDDFYVLLDRNNTLESQIESVITDPITKLNNEFDINSSDILSVRLCNIEHGNFEKVDCKLQFGESGSEFFTNIINIENSEFEKIVKVKNLDVLDKIDELIETLVSQCFIYEEDLRIVQQALDQVPQDIMEKYELNNPVSSHSKSDKLNECNSQDFDHKECLSKSNLIVALNYFINIIESEYELNLNNFELISSLTSQQKIQLQEIFKNLIDFKPNYSLKLKACLIKPKTVRLFDPERDNLDLNTILELSINLMCNPFTGRVIQCESDYSQFTVLNELASNEFYKKEMNKIYMSTGLFGCNSDGLDIKIGNLCLIDLSCSSSSSKYVQTSDSIMFQVSEHCRNDKQVYDFGKEISRALIIDEIEEKCVVLNLDTGKQLTLKKTRIRLLLGDICSVLYKIPFMVIKCKLMDYVEPNSSSYTQIHQSKYYGNTIKIEVLNAWNHEFDIKGLHNIVKVNISDPHSLFPTNPSKRLSVFYMLSHVNSLNNFYIHSHDYEKQLKFIQDLIEIEIEQKKNDKDTPELGRIYAIKEKNKEQ
ncbi:unnamed protein product [Brachionus calyciflorus]|uniref:Uncharacterized protein n=1 Tax=Brachionus calyciflorus TaxID=104777 RepID=A0A814AVN3_9BILA|nr:unnamed protein product [Brachionus calyciflorus]